jgi:type IV/VI secretion system ImpK/VasF family protein
LALSVYDLAVEVVLYLVAFQRRVEDGEDPSYENARAETLTLLNDLDQRSHGEPGLWDNWVKARNPLVYLIDEIMIINANWPHRDRWADECLEVTLLGHPTALGGEDFYKECDQALQELEQAERHERHDKLARAEIVMVFYVAMQTGFKGKYALDQDAWREYKGHVFSKLPAYAQTRTKELFPETGQHTVLLNPNYEPVMRLLYVLIGVVVLLIIYFATTWSYWNAKVGEITQQAQSAAVPTSIKVDGG